MGAVKLHSQIAGLTKANVSGYKGVRWHKAGRKWAARITVQGAEQHLGLFATAEEARDAYLQALNGLRPDKVQLIPAENKAALVDTVQRLYDACGIRALSAAFLAKQKGELYRRLLRVGLNQSVLLMELGLTEEYATWRGSERVYRGVIKSKWSWKTVISEAKKIQGREGDLPTLTWFRLNGYSSLASAVYKSGHTWEDLRSVLGCFATSHFRESRNGMRWRSHPEASLSNFLYARGIVHKRGERYAQGYAEQSGRHYGRLDMHFVSSSETWIDVEVWGDELNALSGGRYQATRAFKEKWQSKNPNFLGIPYRDCLSDEKLTEILQPYIGVIEPFHFDKPLDREIETSHWSDYDELLKACEDFAAQMPDGIFPGESWLRKRGKYKNRPGPAYNTLAIRVHQWIGGTRKLREILGHGHVSTTAWTKEKAIAAWQDFQQKHGLSPSQCQSRKRAKSLSADVLKQAGSIYQRSRSLGVLDEARKGRFERKIKWTPETTIEAWREFTREHGLTPSQCMSASQRRVLPRAVTDKANNIYGAARRLDVLAVARDGS